MTTQEAFNNLAAAVRRLKAELLCVLLAPDRFTLSTVITVMATLLLLILLYHLLPTPL